MTDCWSWFSVPSWSSGCWLLLLLGVMSSAALVTDKNIYTVGFLCGLARTQTKSKVCPSVVNTRQHTHDVGHLQQEAAAALLNYKQKSSRPLSIEREFNFRGRLACSLTVVSSHVDSEVVSLCPHAAVTTSVSLHRQKTSSASCWFLRSDLM